MKYDFETVVNRANTGSSKWDQMKEWNPDVSEGIVPFSVADMEFKDAPEIVEGLKDYIDKTVLGYTGPTENYYSAVCGWMKRRHNWEVKPEWIVTSPGVVPAFFTAVKAFSRPGEGVIIMPPVYYPFKMAIEVNDRKPVSCPLMKTGLTYEINYESLEEKAEDPNDKILLFCSPHNPVGRVWKKEELQRVGEICLRNNIFIISDEIHFDLVMPGNRHTVFASLSDELADNMMVCTAPSKTFNLAGMQTSNIIISNKESRDIYTRESMTHAFRGLNILGYKACEIAYNECEGWLDELLQVVYHNHKVLKDYMEKNIPAVKVFDLEGTYLQWMDFNGLGLGYEELERAMHMDAEVFFDEGYVFGDEGKGFERMNLACPNSVLAAALERLKKTVDKLKK